jgi:glycerol-3-phosphate dehydrogenase
VTIAVLPGDRSADLDADRRARSLARLAGGEPVDVLVIGGGITGAGIALDAATRGLTVALVERRDLAHGTSRWSSKLVHGGLRYLAHGEVGVAWESAVERDRLMRVIAPHLIRPVAQVLPVFRGESGRIARLGATAGDALKWAAARRSGVLPRGGALSAGQIADLVPAVDTSRLIGGTRLWEGQLEDDARLVIAVARTAAAYGAHILTRVACLDVADGAARVRDEVTGTDFEVSSRTAIIATGAWVGDLDPAVRVQPSRGTHLVVRSADLGHPRGALTVAVPGDHSRYVFALPQPDGLTYLGITDVPAEQPIPDDPHPSADEVDWILTHLSAACARPITREQVIGMFAGVRPLVDTGGPADADRAAPETADVSRRHLVRRVDARTVSITGGKLTTYRRMAEDALDLLTDRRCRTASVGLVGAGPVRGAQRVPERLVRRYGSEAARVWAHADADPRLTEPLADGIPTLGVEVVHGVLAEGAMDVGDIIDRRTRLGLVAADAEAALPAVRAIVARTTGASNG